MKSEKLLYVAPRTTRYAVLTEGTFAASDYEPGSEVVQSGKTDVDIDAQIGDDDFTIGSWDE